MNFSNRFSNGTTAFIALIVVAFIAMPFMTILHHERPWSNLMLLAIALVCAMRLLATLRQRAGGEAARLLATRDLTAVVAALLACTAVSTGFSWARGATVVATEFVLLLEILRHRRIA